MRFIRLFWFHFKEYLSDQYFVVLTITNTLSIFLVQYTLAYANHELNNSSIWIQSAIFGMWSSCTTAAGSIGFERLKGTLPYLINNAYDERLSMIALLLPAYLRINCFSFSLGASPHSRCYNWCYYYQIYNYHSFSLDSNGNDGNFNCFFFLLDS